MLDSAREIVEISKEKTREDLEKERLLNLALVRLLEIIGEAAVKVSSETKVNHPEIEWQQIIGLRNRLIHGYDSIDFDIMWTIVCQDIPFLVSMMEKISKDS
ncbi:MAG TPA: hypothetical protein DET40_14525 [Lentisphaeria bacterium]|nr:hypothetical protein [Lentisphaeria bacterium]